MALTLLIMAYAFKRQYLAFASTGGWLLLGAYAYTLSTGADVLYILFWISMGLVLVSAIEAMLLREKKEPEEAMSSLDKYAEKQEKQREKMDKMKRIMGGKSRREE